jgi:hypothetical protein
LRSDTCHPVVVGAEVVGVKKTALPAPGVGGVVGSSGSNPPLNGRLPSEHSTDAVTKALVATDSASVLSAATVS